MRTLSVLLLLTLQAAGASALDPAKRLSQYMHESWSIRDEAPTSQINAIAQFNASADECRSLGDNGTATIFDAAVREEEEHADWFESQLEAIKAIGISGYLAQQVDPGSAPA